VYVGCLSKRWWWWISLMLHYGYCKIGSRSVQFWVLIISNLTHIALRSLHWLKNNELIKRKLLSLTCRSTTTTTHRSYLHKLVSSRSTSLFDRLLSSFLDYQYYPRYKSLLAAFDICLEPSHSVSFSVFLLLAHLTFHVADRLCLSTHHSDHPSHFH